ncbi:uncharacterized protein LOC129583518 [Paramacrobiotus metropolitanus]|uniref:uncharacterized protein LOC129583518 n=1 Tax=Paramacrobiotus metropolitanus TaxID=2943436 RepID=UPI002445F9EA|nr:uncharacterized protein LOC129583518 [Paramacrobiotus metropolitanus]
MNDIIRLGLLVLGQQLKRTRWTHPLMETPRTSTVSTVLKDCGSHQQRRAFQVYAATCAPPPKKTTGAFKAGMTVTKKKIEVESDPHKLVNYLCGGQYLKEGPEIKLKPDNEYPDWLWNLRTGPPPPLSELDPTTMEYWNKVVLMKEIERKMLLKSVRGRYWELRMAKRAKDKTYYRQRVAVWKASGQLLPRKRYNYDKIIEKMSASLSSKS